MSSIKILDSQTISQISVGEIIHSPASVVKELIENSLDAQSTRININIINNGMELISVNDNGLGINKNQLSLALTRYATSKISKIEDLFIIKSFGFRGEALASINAVSRLVLTSKTFKQKYAWKIFSEKEKLISIKPCAHPIGTTVEVYHLFYNVPVRKKFISSSNIEIIKIKELIKKFALSNPEITINLLNNGKLINKFPYFKNQNNIKYRLNSIFGKDFFINLLNFNFIYQDKWNISGFIEKINTKNKNKPQYLFVNKRIINNRFITHAINQAYYDTIIDSDKLDNYHPFYLLNLDIDINEININYHPSKKDIKFCNLKILHDYIYQKIFNLLNQGKNKVSTKELAGINIFSNKKFDNILSEKKIKEKNNEDCLFSFSKESFNKIKNNKNQFFFGKLLTIINNYAILEKNNNIFIISIKLAQLILIKHKLFLGIKKILKFKKLKIPIRIKLSYYKYKSLYSYLNILQKIGIKIKILKKNEILVIEVPEPIFKINKITDLLLLIINNILKKKIQTSEIVKWLTYEIIKNFIYIDTKNIKKQTITLIKELEKYYQYLIKDIHNLFYNININKIIQSLNIKYQKK